MQNNRLEKLQEMLEESPNDIFLNYAVAMEFKGKNRFDLFQKQLEKVLTLDENHVASLYQLGLLLSENQQIEQAIILLEKGLNLAKEKKDMKTYNEFKSLLDELLY